jgi:hypothetical protein
MLSIGICRELRQEPWDMHSQSRYAEWRVPEGGLNPSQAAGAVRDAAEITRALDAKLLHDS